MTEQVLLLSIDGISWPQLRQLTDDMPATAQLMSSAHAIELDTRPFVQPQPIWAQLLTGRDWFENGCTGYSAPVDSLNTVAVCDERALYAPINLIDDQPTTVCVNVPLVQSRNRTWVADGSLPSLVAHSPKELQKYFQTRYKARPYPTLASALSKRSQSGEKIIHNEIARLRATLLILQERDWKEALVRITAFDQLQHIFGLHCFDDTDLKINLEIRSLLNQLDKFISAAKDWNCRIAMISAYCHTLCRSRFNLNALLSKTGFLSTDTTTAATARQQAAASITGHEPPATALDGMDGRLGKSTVAASPVSGCVYLNSLDRFHDGTVSDDIADPIVEQLSSLLHERLLYYFGDRASLYRLPKQESRKTLRKLPQFILYVPQVEFFDSNELILDNTQRPPVCHHARGFLIVDQENADRQTITPVEANGLLRGMGFGQQRQ